MGQSRRFTAAEQSAIWEARREGLSIVRIGRRLDRHFVSVYGLLRRAGGYAPRSRRRSARALRAEEREEISRGLAAGCSLREVARRLGRNASTISRELERNGGPAAYRAAAADARAWECVFRPNVTAVSDG